jgi:hypothetical protein
VPAVFETRKSQPEIDPRFLPAIDRLLITGIRLGRAGKQQAINKVLQLVPEWKRGDCWRRIRQLRRTSDLVGLAHCVQRSPLLSAQPVVAGRRPPSRAWTNEEDRRLLDWAGYEPVTKIAQRLDRSVRAVRFRLGALGMSAKVSDGWSQRSLRKLLRVSPTKLRHLIGSGALRVRDSRISARSLASFCGSNCQSMGGSTVNRVISTTARPHAYSWDRAAGLLGINVAEVQGLICSGKLKVVDPFVTDRAFEEFCRTHPDQINMALIDAPTAKWLANEYGVPENGNGGAISRAQKHALVIRTCKCGRKIAGNVFFKHIRRCRVLKERVMAKAA